jgi:hypothetical protein
MNEHSNIILHPYKEYSIPQRKEDGYVNVTVMCQIHGKQFKNWHGCKNSKAYLKELSAVAGIPASELLVITKGGSHSQGTWAHKLVAMEIAKWISPTFAVWCNQHLLELMETGSTKLEEKYIAKQKSPSDYIDQLVSIKPLVADDLDLFIHTLTSILNRLTTN